MPKFPPPPGVAALRAIPPAEQALPAGTLLWRVYAAGGTHPARWDEFRAFGLVATMRFDHHTSPRRAQSPVAASSPCTVAASSSRGTSRSSPLRRSRTLTAPRARSSSPGMTTSGMPLRLA